MITVEELNFPTGLLSAVGITVFLANLIIGDEASFRMNGEVNTQNVREYAPRGNVHNFYYDRNDSRTKITVWVGLCGNGALLQAYSFLKVM